MIKKVNPDSLMEEINNRSLDQVECARKASGRDRTRGFVDIEFYDGTYVTVPKRIWEEFCEKSWNHELWR